MTKAKRPTTVYKYRNVEDENHLAILKANEIYFAVSAQMNDPFDCSIPFAHWDAPDTKNKEYIKLILPDSMEYAPPELAGKNIEELVDWRMGFKPITRELQVEEEIQVINFLTENYGVFCVGTDNDETGIPGYANNLMWSHYASSHTGFCVGFNVEKLLAPIMPDPFFEEVRYGAAYPKLTPYKSDGTVERISDDDILTALLSKDECWKYEREWRLIRHNKTSGSGRGVSTIPPDSIESVFLGVAMTRENKEKVKNILSTRANRPKLYEAKRADGTYRLRFIEVPY